MTPCTRQWYKRTSTRFCSKASTLNALSKVDAQELENFSRPNLESLISLWTVFCQAAWRIQSSVLLARNTTRSLRQSMENHTQHSFPPSDYCANEMLRSYISELLGQPKRKENLADLLSSSSVLSLRLGRVDVRFQQPWSLREFVTQQMSRMPGQIDSNSQMISYTERGRILRTLGYRVLSDINNVSVMMPTALVGTVLLTLRGRGVAKGSWYAD